MTTFINQAAEFTNAIANAARLLSQRLEDRSVAQAEIDALARAVVGMAAKLQSITLAFTDEVSAIENDLTGALNEELEDRRDSPRSWAAAGRAIRALSARDTKIAELHDALAWAAVKADEPTTSDED